MIVELGESWPRIAEESKQTGPKFCKLDAKNGLPDPKTMKQSPNSIRIEPSLTNLHRHTYKIVTDGIQIHSALDVERLNVGSFTGGTQICSSNNAGCP